MRRRKNADDPSSQRAKRVRSSIPTLRMVQSVRKPASTPTNSNSNSNSRTSRVSILKRVSRGRRGYLSEDRVHRPDTTGPPESPDISIDQQVEGIGTDDDFLGLDLGKLDDSATLTATQTQKPKRTRKNTTSVSFFHHSKLNSNSQLMK